LYNFWVLLRKGPVSGTFMLFSLLSAVTKRILIFYCVTLSHCCMLLNPGH